MRLFVAVNVPAVEVPGLSPLSGPAPLHFTLKFLGEVEDARVAEILRALDRALQGAHGGRATLAGMGGFPSNQRPRVLWIGVEQGKEILADLSRRVEAACTGLGFPREERPFQPHVTIARIRNREAEDAARQAIAAHAQRVFAHFEIREVVLKQSVLGHAGAVHTPLGAVPLPPSLT